MTSTVFKSLPNIEFSSSEEKNIFLKNHRLLSYYFSKKEILTQDEKQHLQFNQIKNLKLLSEIQLISQKLKKNNITHLFLKGVILSQQIYNDIGIRETRDIDILIGSNYLAATHELLKNNGYKPEQNENEIFEGKYLKYFHHISYRNPSKKIMIELHLRPFSMGDFWVDRDFSELSAFYSVSGTQLPVLKNEYMVIYLCIHGSLHKWSELIWVADIAQYLSKYEHETDWQKVIKISNQQGTEKTLYLGLLLAHRIFEVKIPDEIIMPKNKSIEKLYNTVVAGYSLKEPSQTTGKWKKLIYFMQLKKDIRFKFRCIYFRFFRATI